MKRALRTLSLSLVLLLGFAGAPLWAQPAAPPAAGQPGYTTVHPAPPAWLAERFRGAEARVASPTWDGPKAEPELVRGFLHETYEHIREVNTLLESLGGRGRPIPGVAPADGVIRGVHDFGERVSLERLEAFIAEVKVKPLTDFRTKAPIPMPAWLEGIAREARGRGERSVDVGKLSPYVAAGLAQPGTPDRYAIELHRLSPHHGAETPRGSLLKEMIADRVNAMRQVRVYSKQPMSFERIAEIVLGDVGKGLPQDARPLVLEALERQRALEKGGKVNPYHLLEEPAKPAPKADRLARYRRADGTVDWAKLGGARALQGAGGVAHFGLALFLKELAVVAQTGDRARLEEFFEGLLTTDFYAEYGLFAIGAAGGELAYSRYLQQYVKPRFVSSILRTNLALATGLAVPQLVHGNFSGKAFAVSLGSLGLSASAVQAGVRGIAWVRELQSARRTSAALATTGRLARAGGWFYTVAETAVVLYLADEVEGRINAYLDAAAAKDALVEAGADLRAALADPQASPASVAAAADAHHSAWGAYRDFLYRPLGQADARLAERLGQVAREAKLSEDERLALLARAEASLALKARIERRFGSLEAYGEARLAARETEQAEAVRSALARYEELRKAHLAEIYSLAPREGALLDGVRREGGERADWLLLGAEPGARGDPYSGRRDLLARVGRSRAEAALADALRGASGNRLQAYEDEAELLRATARALEAAGKGELAGPLVASAERALSEQDLDRRAVRGGLLDLAPPPPSAGATGTLEESLRDR